MLLRIVSMLVVLLSSVSAWQIKGKVTDVRGKPLSEAQVCVRGGASECVATTSKGAFTISGTATGLHNGERFRPSGRNCALEIRSGGIFINAPDAGLARIEWFDATGRCLSKARTIAMISGMNRLGMAPSFSGVLFLRLAFGTIRQTWEMVIGGIGNRVTPVLPARDPMGPVADAVTAAPVITASKSGFKSRNYYAINAVLDTLAWILLATSDDDTTYKLEGASYPLCAIPPNQLVGTSPYDGCSTIVYSGNKVRGLRVSSTAAIFNNVFAPKDSTFLVTVSYECAGNDAHSDCSQRPGAKTNACRPIQFKINNQSYTKVFWTECTANPDWCHDLFDSIPLPLKAGLNKLEFFSTISDMPDLDRIIVKDGRVY